MAVRKTKKGLALKRWLKEDWRTPSGEKDYSKGENTFRPTKKISKDTPKTWSQLSAGEKRAAAREKNKKGRVSRYKKGGKYYKYKSVRDKFGTTPIKVKHGKFLLSFD